MVNYGGFYFTFVLQKQGYVQALHTLDVEADALPWVHYETPLVSCYKYYEGWSGDLVGWEGVEAGGS